MLDNELTDFAKQYLQLGLRINKHINGYIDYYYGPRNIKLIIENENIKSPKSLLKACKKLQNQLRNQGFDENRIKFFDKTLLAIHTILQKLNGEKIPYLTLIENIFDFTPEFYDDDYFYNLAIKANEIYCGPGTLLERMNQYAAKRVIPVEKVKKIFQKAINVARNRTYEIFPNLLPKIENIKIKLVKDQSWGMYNWYLGNFQSIIEINRSYDVYWTALLDYACHEAYPGHHTESTIKEIQLFKNKSFFESSIKLLYSPEMVISEGIGRTAESVLFDPTESILIQFNDLCLNPENEDDIETLIQQSYFRKKLHDLQSKLAYYKIVGNWGNDDIIKFAKDLGLLPEIGIKFFLNSISNEIWAIYFLIYQGERIIVKKFGVKPDPKKYQQLFLKEFLPSDLI